MIEEVADVVSMFLHSKVSLLLEIRWYVMRSLVHCLTALTLDCDSLT